MCEAAQCGADDDDSGDDDSQQWLASVAEEAGEADSLLADFCCARHAHAAAAEHAAGPGAEDGVSGGHPRDSPQARAPSRASEDGDPHPVRLRPGDSNSLTCPIKTRTCNKTNRDQNNAGK
jgi:hypothetical protein